MPTSDRADVRGLFSPRRAALLVLAAAPLCAAGSCTVEAKSCSDSCDPCFESCECEDRTCEDGLAAGDQDVLRLGTYVLELVPVADDPAREGAIGLRVWRPVTGPSAARAWPGRAWRPSDLVPLSRAILRAQPELFGETGGLALAALEDFAGATVVELASHEGGVSSSFTLLYDPAGTLIEIDQRRAAAR